MKITVAKSAGFCFGVKRAIQMALSHAKTNSSLEMLGDIVHNEQVVEEIKKAGIRKISSLRVSGKGKTLLIRAHGARKATIAAAASKGYTIIDATCPMVKEIHRIATEMEGQGYRVIIIGDKKHDEVIGITGQLSRGSLVIDSPSSLPLARLKAIRKAAVVVQSTQNLEKVLAIVDALKKHIKDLRFFNTICKPTSTKQAEIKTMPLDNDIMVIIGSKTSANTKRLYELSRSLNRRTYWIQSPDELRREWFKGVETVGISAGASTPDRTTQGVIARIGSLAKGARGR